MFVPQHLDALGGGGIQGISRLNAPLSRAVSNQVTAVIMYGDPRHLIQAPFNVGTATKDGVRLDCSATLNNSNRIKIFPRSMNQSLNAFADKTKAFCNGTYYLFVLLYDHRLTSYSERSLLRIRR